MGKSSLARGIADAVHATGAGVHAFTPEDNAQTYALRALSGRSGVAIEAMLGLRVREAELSRISEACDDYSSATRWLVDDTAGLGSAELAARVRRHRRENDTQLVVVDYLQLLHEPNVPAHDLRVQVEQATRNLVALARTERVAVLALSQLSRRCEERPDKRPTLADLRESGALEQAAEAVMMVYRDDVYNAGAEPGVTEVILRKNKNGRTGVVRLFFNLATTTFSDLSAREAPRNPSDYPPPPQYADDSGPF
jgi:replicative DNA helicase